MNAMQSVFVGAWSLSVLLAGPLSAQTLPGPQTAVAAQVPASPGAALGVMRVHVDATDLDHRVFRIRQTLPVRPGALTLHYPRFLPGTHGPYGEIERLAGLIVQAQGQGLINPTLPPLVVLYTLYARACDPVVTFLKDGGQYSDAEIVELVVRTCFDGLSAR